MINFQSNLRTNLQISDYLRSDSESTLTSLPSPSSPARLNIHAGLRTILKRVPSTVPATDTKKPNVRWRDDDVSQAPVFTIWVKHFRKSLLETQNKRLQRNPFFNKKSPLALQAAQDRALVLQREVEAFQRPEALKIDQALNYLDSANKLAEKLGQEAWLASLTPGMPEPEQQHLWKLAIAAAAKAFEAERGLSLAQCDAAAAKPGWMRIQDT